MTCRVPAAQCTGTVFFTSLGGCEEVAVASTARCDDDLADSKRRVARLGWRGLLWGLLALLLRLRCGLVLW
jgi:hypothetical protein